MQDLTFEVTHYCNGVIFRRFTVPAIERGVYGVYFDGVPYGPCEVSVAEKMPKTLSKAIFRGCGFWITNLSDIMQKDLQGYSRGYAKQGKPLGTLIARAIWI
jgi:hypothetical protein